MKVLEPIDNYERFRFSARITPRQPDSGFSLCFGLTGESDSFYTGIKFYGSGGLIFDNENKFFGGYQSGRSFEIDGHFFGDENRMSYFYDNKLVRNNLLVTGNFDTIEFEKFGNSNLDISFEYISGYLGS
jgi:hypothetical protein